MSARATASTNLVGLAGAVIAVAYCAWARARLGDGLGLWTAAVLIGFAAVLLCLPDWLHQRLGGDRRWLRCPELLTIALLPALAVVGWGLRGYPLLLGGLAIGAGGALAAREIARWRPAPDWGALIGGVLLFVLLYGLFYSRGYHTPVVGERLVGAGVHQDVLFHASLLNLVSTFGFPSTGLDGVPYCHYHWGSHALLAGLRPWSGAGALELYSIAYPAWFVPLFVALATRLVGRLCSAKGVEMPGPLVVWTVLAALYAADLYGFSNAHPFVSESFCLSLCVGFALLGALCAFREDPAGGERAVLWVGVLVIASITFLKISTGFTFAAAAAFLLVRWRGLRRSAAPLALAGLVIAALAWLFLLPALGGAALPFRQRWETYWSLSNGIFTYPLGLLILAVAWLKAPPAGGWRGLLADRSRLDLEALGVGTAAGLAAATVASASQSDVFYFCAPPFFVAVAVVIVAVQRAVNHLGAPGPVRSVALVAIILLGLVVRPDTLEAVDEPRIVRRSLRSPTAEQRLRGAAIARLRQLDREEGKAQRCVYIAADQTWYYGDGQPAKLADLLLVPAVAGVPLVGGLFDERLRGQRGYCLGEYGGGAQAAPADLAAARERAARQGCEELVVFQRDEAGGLREERHRSRPAGVEQAP